MRLRRIIPRFSLRTLVILLLLVTSALGLHWRRKPWQLARLIALDRPVDNIFISQDGAVLDVHYHDRTSRQWDLRALGVTSGYPPPEETWAPAGTNFSWISGGGNRPGEPDAVRIWHPFWGLVGHLTGHRGQIGPVAGSVYVGIIATAAEDDSVRIWRSRRPYQWWGVFYLWEFWLTVAFAGLFVWSVWRDRSALKGAAEDGRGNGVEA